MLEEGWFPIILLPKPHSPPQCRKRKSISQGHTALLHPGALGLPPLKFHSAGTGYLFSLEEAEDNYRCGLIPSQEIQWGFGERGNTPPSHGHHGHISMLGQTWALKVLVWVPGSCPNWQSYQEVQEATCRKRLLGDGFQFSSVQSFSHVLLCDSINRSTPGLTVHQQLPESTQSHVHWVTDAIQRSHPLSYPSPPTLNLSQHQGLFKWVNSLYQVAKLLEFQLQHQSFQWKARTDLL